MAVRATGLSVLPIVVSPRTTWLFVRLATNAGVCGLGEASLGRTRELPELSRFYALLDESLSITAYRQAGWQLARRGGMRAAAAFSAIEMALWDLRGKLLGVPTYELLGGLAAESGAPRRFVDVYANVNRMTRERTPRGFARSAALAREAGFRAIKAAPFDALPAAGEPRERVEEATELGIEAMFAVRAAAGADAAVKVDCHSRFGHDQAVRVAQRLAPVRLDWYEEPLPISDVTGTRAVRDAIGQRMAGGESLYGLDAFAPLMQAGAVDVAMPDVALCGGVLELLHVARAAAAHGIALSPHNPRGPVATAASLAVCAVAEVESLELQWGETNWRGDLVDPPERPESGRLAINDGPGFGIELANVEGRVAS